VRKVQRWRYYCDFCKKAGNSGFHIGKHEQSCTMNPDRVCRMCKSFADQQPPMAAMLALLPDADPDLWTDTTEFLDNQMRAALAVSLPKLRDLCGDCPVCIFAALRQKRIPVPLAEGFDLKSELASAWNDANTEGTP
jgi:hypothetical protein